MPRLAAGVLVTSLPSNKILPEVTCSRPANILKVVVLPHPEGPSKKCKAASLIVKESTGTMPVLHIREGEIMKELKALIDEEKNINVLVLAANVNETNKNPGPIINSLVTKEFSNFRVPVMIVPGNFSKDHIALIT